MKYDVIIGNPPYTHLRNMENRRYARYPKQRDMAQVFVRWGLDHGEVISYNSTDTWLDVKICDGAMEVRKLLLGKFREIIQNDEIAEYSVEDGGNTTTFIFCFDHVNKNNVVYNELKKPYKEEDLLRNPRFCRAINLPDDTIDTTTIKQYTTMKGTRSNKKSNKEFNDKFNGLIYDKNGNGEYYIVCKRIMGCRSRGSRFKLIESNNIQLYINDNISSEIKYCKVSRETGLWLVGYLNTKNALIELRNTLRPGKTDGNKGGDDWLLVVAAGTFSYLRVPDFDYYKSKHPRRHAAFLKWVEDNMRDKDKFLAGIDTEFEKLIKE